MPEENEQRGGPIFKESIGLLPAGKLLYQMTVSTSKFTRVVGWLLIPAVVVIFSFMVYSSCMRLFAKAPSDKAKATTALVFDVRAFDKALVYAGDHFSPQDDAYDLRQKWWPKVDEYGDKLLGCGASKEQLDKLIRHPPAASNDPKMGEYYKKIAAELDKMA